MVLFLNNQSHSDRDFKVLDRLSISEEVISLRLNGTGDRLFEVRFRKECGVAQSWPDSSDFSRRSNVSSGLRAVYLGIWVEVSNIDSHSILKPGRAWELIQMEINFRMAS